MNYKWMPGPAYLCRRHLVLDLVDQVKPESVLEIGFGAGDLIRVLNDRGYKGAGIDFSEEACKYLLAQHEGKKLNFKIEAKPEAELDARGEKYGLVMAFEVLEHIEDDLEALKRWHNLVADGGCLLMSVPAHAKDYNEEDRAAGHIRRYERSGLEEKLSAAGFRTREFYCYGYPLMNLSRKIRMRFAPKSSAPKGSMEERSKEIGQGLVFWRLGKYLFNDFVLFPAYLLQKLFLKSDLGDGYLVLAEKIQK
jgi:SAM-dependent methyltransferase